jgi:fructose-1,6-bisphosphatase/inositol monophosphatase family enzyme
MTVDLAKVEATLLAAADAAATRTLPLFRTTLAIDNKYQVGFDPVTEADRGAETAIRAVIAEAFPDHAIIGENGVRAATAPIPGSSTRSTAPAPSSPEHRSGAR